MSGLRYFFASLLTEDDANKVPDLSRILWFVAAVLALIGILVFFALALVLAMRDAASFALLREYATAFALLLTGFGTFMALCAGALAIKTKSGA